MARCFELQKPQVIRAAHEVALGKLERMKMTDVAAELPEFAKYTTQEVKDFAKCCGESDAEVDGRMDAMNVQNDSASTEGEKRVLLVSHGFFGTHLV